MLEEILKIERDAFLFLNGHHTPFWDQFMWLFSGQVVWLPVVIVFLFAVFYPHKPHSRIRLYNAILLLISIVIVVALCDQFASSLCKPLFTRPRPTHHKDFMDSVVTVFGYRGGRYGFISSHAANAFGFVTLTSLIFRHKWYSITFFIWATVTAYSRIYLGVHFISDIIPGIITGIVFGWIVFRLYLIARRKISASTYELPVIYPKMLNLIIYVMLAVIIMELIISLLYSTDILHPVILKNYVL